MWITDRLPEPNKKVLVYDLFYGEMVAYYDFVAGFCCYDKSIGRLQNVVGWLDLPDKCSSTTRIVDKIGSYRLSV